MKAPLILIVWLLLSVPVRCQVTSPNTCKVHAIYNDVTLFGGMKAGVYIPFDDQNAPTHMTVTKCTEHCCQTGAADVVFLLNKYCYCVICYSVQLCSPVAITPPRGFKPVAVVLNKGIFKVTTSAPTKPLKSVFSIAISSYTKQSVDRGTDQNVRTTAGGREREGQEGLTGQITLPPAAAATKKPTTLPPTRMVSKERTVIGKGNEDITLQCAGTMDILRVVAFGITGDKGTVKDFNKYCKANMKKVDDSNVCLVSLKKVYETNYPPFIQTRVTYNCTYLTRDPE
ncbi:uncharacterized protein LOC116618548 isoform X2 [Nematostella vectensis]|uniref:uncharacterized protein LOC116618548 isoform X2 n=1 Tax=Nematostella vectensis TaxID=45351 RepID=UPI0013906CB5|nr:uncharacterized protein LOC116618548 isoform X2 [Nematostella vectensis]XP_048582513.1 uncharacterized protein LOC116618548 isoform X2 [Nematostella vectensis]XP_048582514.1 uncharacterized protein LOC116618548 isoform X2 [Nematostella vectensis]